MKGVKLRDDNYYLKDESLSYEQLKGEWLWTNKSDTLTLKIVPIYKKKYDENIYSKRQNAYYDTALIQAKFSKQGDVIVNQISYPENDVCLFAQPLGIYTTMFYVYNKCRIGVFDQPVLMFAGNDLVLVNKWNEEEGVFFEKDGEYKIVIPRTITLKRLE